MNQVAQAADSKDLLKAEEAYRISGESVAPDLIQLTWQIADSYHLYKSKFRFTSNTPGITFGAPVFPKGKLKHDEFFGEMEVYYNQVTVALPLLFAEGGATAKEINITTVSQGCADIGVCYPPHTQQITLTLMPSASGAINSTTDDSRDEGGLLALLGNKFGFAQKKSGEFLEADQAFTPPIFDVTPQNSLIAHFEIAEGYYLYRDKVAFAITRGEGVTLGKATAPAGEFKNDENFGRMEVYYHQTAFTMPLIRTSGAAQTIELEVRYQGCAEAGFCYPPITKVFPVELPKVDLASITSINDLSNTTATAAVATTTAPLLSEQDRFAQSLAGDNIFLVMAAFFGVGLLLAFTPCVFPMIPILSSIIVGQGATTSTRKAFTLSLAYVLAMALTYTVAGVIAGMTGENLQAAFQNPWILGSFSLVFVALSLSMFGFYDLQLPSSLQSRLATLSNRQSGGTVIGAAIMGFLSALIVGPCVAAPLAGALIYIGQTGDALLGGLALFALSMGMGAPLLLIGTSAGKLLPRVGDWMNAIKAVFGVLLLGVAIWMLERILPATLSLLLWALLAIVSAVYLGALRRLGPDANGWQKLWQGTGLAL
ncbi:MAG: dsbDH, partial [Halothiobacillaceae bacterium]